MYYICCKVLGVKPGSDIETIKAAYRKAAKELHPDLNHSEKASQYFIILQNAYEYLLEHAYTAKEIESITRTTKAEKTQHSRSNFTSYEKYYRNPLEGQTLREILAHSLTARILFMIFHIIFLTTGIYLIIRTSYDFVNFPVDPRTPLVSAYLVIVFGFVFGVIITSVFLYSGISFIKKR
jgi:hypothetical protein